MSLDRIFNKSVGRESDLRELVGRKKAVAEAEDAFAEPAEVEVRLVERLPPLVSDRLLHAVDEDRRRTIDYPLRSALHHQQVPLVLPVVHLVHGHLRITRTKLLYTLSPVSTEMGWGKGRNVTSAGWQVTLCDLTWHLSSGSGEECLRTAIRIYLYPYLTRPYQGNDFH